MALTTSLDRGTLTITGDAAADDIAIVGTSNPGELVVTGLNDTLVNGIANGSITISGVRGSLNVNLGGGDDVLSLDNTYIAESIAINTGDGDDLVTLGEDGEVSPAWDLFILTGDGNDRVVELNYAVFVGDEHSVHLGPGHDVATIVGTSAVGGVYLHSFTTGLEVFGDEGNDSILAKGVTAVQRIQISGGEGINSMALLFSAAREIDVSARYDPQSVDTTSPSIFYLDTNYSQTRISVRTHDATVNVLRSQTTSLSIFLEGRNNSVNLYGNAINGPSYFAWRGEQSPLHVGPTLHVTRAFSGVPAAATADTVSLSYNIVGQSVVGEVSIALASGDDSLTLTGNIFASKATLNGGPGRNTIREWYNVWASLSVQNFA